jgi:hypothetical protein
MSQAEHPERLVDGHTVTVEDVRQLMGASTPHFALQLRNRIGRLIEGLAEGEREIARLTRLGVSGEVRGHAAEDGMDPLASLRGGAGEPEPAG